MPFLTFGIYETMAIKRFTSIILGSEKKNNNKKYSVPWKLLTFFSLNEIQSALAIQSGLTRDGNTDIYQALCQIST